MEPSASAHLPPRDQAVMATYEAAAGMFVALVARIDDAQWALPALGVWDVRALVGHASRAMILVEQYLQPSGEVTLADGAAYLRAAGQALADPAAVAQRGVDSGRALGDHPAAAVAGIWARVAPLVREAPPSAVAATPAGTLAFDRYLENRVVELVVHSLDLAQALGAEVDVPAPALRMTLHQLANSAVEVGRGTVLALVLTGRQPLPEAFSVVP